MFAMHRCVETGIRGRGLLDEYQSPYPPTGPKTSQVNKELQRLAIKHPWVNLPMLTGNVSDSRSSVDYRLRMRRACGATCQLCAWRVHDGRVDFLWRSQAVDTVQRTTTGATRRRVTVARKVLGRTGRTAEGELGSAVASSGGRWLRGTLVSDT